MSRPAPASLVMHALRMQKNATASGNASKARKRSNENGYPKKRRKRRGGGGQGIRGINHNYQSAVHYTGAFQSLNVYKQYGILDKVFYQILPFRLPKKPYNSNGFRGVQPYFRGKTAHFGAYFRPKVHI